MGPKAWSRPVRQECRGASGRRHLAMDLPGLRSVPGPRSWDCLPRAVVSLSPLPSLVAGVTSVHSVWVSAGARTRALE